MYGLREKKALYLVSLYLDIISVSASAIIYCPALCLSETYKPKCVFGDSLWY